MFINTCFVAYHVIYLGKYPKMCILLLWMEWSVNIEVCLPNVLFRADVSLLIFHLNDIAIDISRIIKSPIIKFILNLVILAIQNIYVTHNICQLSSYFCLCLFSQDINYSLIIFIAHVTCQHDIYKVDD